MKLSKEQISNLKNQLLEQIKHIPENQRKEAEKQIEDLSDEAVEEMLNSQKDNKVKIFRDIVSGKISSRKIDENNESLAVLDIKPISKGHTIIIPKEKLESIDKISNNISILIDNISKRLLDKLKAKEIKIIPELKFGEVIINLIPIYDENLSLESERTSPPESDLDKIIETINKKEEIKVKLEEKEIQKEEIKKFKRRIP